MKNIIIYICSLAVLFGVVSCDKLPVTDPIDEPVFYFQIKEKGGEGRNFFAVDTTYNTDSVTMTYTNGYTGSSKIIFRKNRIRSFASSLPLVFHAWCVCKKPSPDVAEAIA